MLVCSKTALLLIILCGSVIGGARAAFTSSCSCPPGFINGGDDGGGGPEAAGLCTRCPNGFFSTWLHDACEPCAAGRFGTGAGSDFLDADNDAVATAADGVAVWKQRPHRLTSLLRQLQ